MANQGRLELPTTPPHVLEVGCSLLGHRAYVTLDGKTVHDHLTWEKPGRDWVLELPGLPECPLQVQIRCFFAQLHYPHTHVLVARWGDVRLVIPPAGMDVEPLLRSAEPPFSA